MTKIYLAGKRGWRTVDWQPTGTEFRQRLTDL
jgi:hypothetical protein